MHRCSFHLPPDCKKCGLPAKYEMNSKRAGKYKVFLCKKHADYETSIGYKSHPIVERR